MNKKFHLLYILLFICTIGHTQIVNLQWKSNLMFEFKEDSTFKVINFEGANFSPDKFFIPYYSQQIETNFDNYEVIFLPGIVSIVDIDSLSGVAGVDKIPQDFIFEYHYAYFRKQPILSFSVIPLRFNKLTGNYEKLLSFYYDITEKEKSTNKGEKSYSVTNSVLATGEWYKFLIPENGVYKITYKELSDWGIDLTTVDPKTLKIFGNGGKMLSEIVSDDRYDDLHEVPIQIIGEEDGVFNSDDYILLYGDGPDKWYYNTKSSMYMFNRNLYTRNSGYFLTFGGAEGKRIAYKQEPSGVAEEVLTSYLDHQAYEPCLYHLTKSGKRWFGDRFDIQTNYDFNFSFPDIITDKKVKFSYMVASRASASSSMTVKVNDYSQTHVFRSVGTTLGSTYAYQAGGTTTFTTTSESMTMSMNYTKPNSSATAWVRYIYMNAYRNLIYNTGLLFFRNTPAETVAKVGEFRVTTNNGNAKIMDISNPVEPMLINYSQNGSYLSFKIDLMDENEFICFDETSYKSITFSEKVDNQNIHGMDTPDMVIVYHKDFKEATEMLYNYHNANGLVTYMIDIDDVYNEFSSGVQDVCAVRDMMRYWYKNSQQCDEPQYLLLFGDASYDPLDRLSTNTNFIPLYQSEETLSPSFSFCSDDFCGFLDDNEGTFNNDELLDISVGRIPVQTAESAMQVVKKILHYASDTPQQHGDWKNIITLVCDDADNTGSGYETRHLDAAEKYAEIIETKYKQFNVNKVYTGAYQQVTAAGGQRYPEVNDAINARLEQGTLVFGYNGHGGELCLALEQIVTIADINSWSNYDRLSFVITATCEFSRYDDPDRTAAGEYVFLNPKGGALSMLTTARLTDASTNLTFCSFVYNNIFSKDEDNNYPTVGEFVLKSKNDYILKGYSFENISPYVIFGDPAISLNYPNYNSVEITDIKVDGMRNDTIKALSKVEVEGIINDFDGNVLSDFNGIIFPEFRDKKTLTSTLGNDGAEVQYFYVDKSIIHKGKAKVTNGKFSLSFITPKDIAYNFGSCKTSFYFSNDSIDGNGYFDNYIVGGSSSFSVDDTDGPQIKLFINDSTFSDGDYTNENPVIFASLHDKSGINTTGNGIGHDIIAILDDNTERTYNLNTYFENDLNSYQHGIISYPLFNLEEGEHSIVMRAWDVYNNSSKSMVRFVVVKSGTIKLVDLFNYPNPFTDNTTFSLKHNQAGETLKVDLYIFSSNGKLVNRLTSSITTSGFKDDVFYWDGNDLHGNNVSNGMYVYKVVVTKDDGTQNHASGKLIKL